MLVRLAMVGSRLITSHLVAAAVATLVLGCAAPAERFDALADSLSARSVVARGFRLRVYERGERDGLGHLHVYLEGDGRPWRTRTQVSADPTPMRALALELMTRDPGWSLYLGRPCYFGESWAPDCGPWMWTSGRYSAVVVDAMAAALEDMIAAHHVTELSLIGYSGGGVIAWLLAERIPQVTRLVTVAANLDIDAWTRHHGYSPLSESLNPSARASLPERVRHWYVIGGRDQEVPPSLIDERSNPAVRNARILRLDADHRCCWVDAWPGILATIAQADALSR